MTTVSCPKHNRVLQLNESCADCLGEDSMPIYYKNVGGDLMLLSAYGSKPRMSLANTPPRTSVTCPDHGEELLLGVRCGTCTAKTRGATYYENIDGEARLVTGFGPGIRFIVPRAPAMTPEQEQHLDRIQRVFSLIVSGKYRKGQSEHGGNLWDVSAERLIEMAIEEAIDQVTYLVTLRDKLVKFDADIAESLRDPLSGQDDAL